MEKNINRIQKANSISQLNEQLNEDLLSPKQVCSMLNITRFKLMQILRMGELPYTETMGRIRIRRSDVAKLVIR